MKRLTYDRIIRHLKTVLREADLLIEIVDARFPKETRNLHFERMIKRKPLLIVINKIDLADRKDIADFTEELERKRIPYAVVSCRERRGRKSLMTKIYEIIEKDKNLQKKEKVKIGVIGYPDVGKSSLINMLSGKRKTTVSSRPGTTRGKQYIRLDENILLIDSPGVFPKGERIDKLTLHSAFDVDRLDDPVPLAIELIESLLTSQEYGPRFFKLVYDVDVKPTDEPENILERITLRRGMLLKGGEPNISQMANTLLKEWQTGKMITKWKKRLKEVTR